MVTRLYDALGTWQDIADLLAEHGAAHPRSYWRSVGLGRFRPGWRERDALLMALGREPRGPAPAEVVAASGVGHVIAACEDPDIALLVRTDGRAPKRVSVSVDSVTVEESHSAPKLVVTRVTRNRAPSQRVPRMSQIAPVDAARLGRGRSGFSPAIAEAAWRAAEMLGEVTE